MIIILTNCQIKSKSEFCTVIWQIESWFEAVVQTHQSTHVWKWTGRLEFAAVRLTVSCSSTCELYHSLQITSLLLPSNTMSLTQLKLQHMFYLFVCFFCCFFCFFQLSLIPRGSISKVCLLDLRFAVTNTLKHKCARAHVHTYCRATLQGVARALPTVCGWPVEMTNTDGCLSKITRLGRLFCAAKRSRLQINLE